MQLKGAAAAEGAHVGQGAAGKVHNGQHTGQQGA